MEMFFHLICWVRFNINKPSTLGRRIEGHVRLWKTWETMELEKIQQQKNGSYTFYGWLRISYTISYRIFRSVFAISSRRRSVAIHLCKSWHSISRALETINIKVNVIVNNMFECNIYLFYIGILFVGLFHCTSFFVNNTHLTVFRGFLKGDKLLGTVSIKLQPLEDKCIYHDSYDVISVFQCFVFTCYLCASSGLELSADRQVLWVERRDMWYTWMPQVE